MRDDTGQYFDPNDIESLVQALDRNYAKREADWLAKIRSDREKVKTPEQSRLASQQAVVSREQQAELHLMEQVIMDSVERAKSVGVPQGLIVAILHEQAYQQTVIMVERA